jgi:hypothetical protein
MMRGKAAIVACVGLALLAGCNTLDRNYLREGAGTDVPTTDIVTATNLQQIYFGEVCRQAGLPLRPTPDGIFLCDELAMPPPAWALFVQAGMNDIDRRCDAYLVWLDDRRRWREPILKQLHSTAAATAAIMGLTGVGAAPIAIVGAAFGFAQETFVNLSGRLITEVNHSTVQTVVLTRQNDYRAGLRNIAIPNAPAALYALRSYLRLCMPMTIETEINATITTVDRTGRAPVPLVTPATINSGIITSATAPIPASPRQRDPVAPNRLTGLEQSLSVQYIRDVEAALCVPEDGDLGPPGSATRVAIRDYLLARTGSSPTADGLTAAQRNLLTDAVKRVGVCTDRKYQNAFEVGAFGAAQGDPKARIKDFQENLRAALSDLKSPAATTVPTDGDLDNKTRDAILEYRRLSNTLLTPANNPRNRQVDFRLKRSVTP